MVFHHSADTPNTVLSAADLLRSSRPEELPALSQKGKCSIRADLEQLHQDGSDRGDDKGCQNADLPRPENPDFGANWSGPENVDAGQHQRNECGTNRHITRPTAWSPGRR